MDHIAKIVDIIQSINKLSVTEKKKTGFLIGNTAKINLDGLYFTPIRITKSMVLGGVIVYSESQAIDIIKEIDGKVNYIIVDAEKKIADKVALGNETINIERAVRETTNHSKLWVYKGNDLSVEAIDTLLSYLYKDSLRGLGRKKVAIIGGGNLGSKLALKLVERGASVILTRRNLKKLKKISDAINIIKPAQTIAKVNYTTNNELAAKNADIIIGATNGIPAITHSMIKALSKKAIIIDIGKGTLSKEAIKYAISKSLLVYRLDITAALSGLLECCLCLEDIVENKMGRREFKGQKLVAGGLLGLKGDLVVDSINDPSMLYGIADGEGDFIRSIPKDKKKIFEELINQNK